MENITTAVDYEKYPINDANSDAYKTLVKSARESLATAGRVSFPGFLTDAGLQSIVSQINDKRSIWNKTKRCGNAYDLAIPEGTPEDHALRILEDSSYSSLGRHLLVDTEIETLYTTIFLKNFIRDVTGEEALYFNDDPYNAAVVMIYEPGDEIAWHFDYGYFSCLFSLQEIEEGGFHEVVPNIRSEADQGYEEVAKVVRGDRSNVKQSRSIPGSFSIFRGQHALHRVTQVEGYKTRMSLVLTYETQPGVQLEDDVRARYFSNNHPDAVIRENLD